MIQFWRFCWFLLKRFERNENRRNAAELTYVTLFAVVPLMTSGYVMLTWFPQYTNFIQSLHDMIFSHFIPGSGDVIKGYLNAFSQQAKNLTWIGLAILIFSAISLMLTIEKSFNTIWRVKTHRVGRRVVFYWLAVVVGPILLGTAFLISSYLLSSNLWIEHIDSSLHVNQFIVKLLPFAISILALMAMYYFLPCTHVSALHAFIGGLFGTTLLEICKVLFVKLVSLSPSYQLVYGAFAVVPLFLLWVFFAWCIILLGAELTRALPFIRKELQGIQATDLDWSLLILKQLSDTSKQNPKSRQGLIKALNLVNLDDWEAVLNQLLSKGWVSNDVDDYYLNVDLSMRTVGELSELIHGETLERLSVIKSNTPWFNVLKPKLLEIREQKKTALGLSISEVLN